MNEFNKLTKTSLVEQVYESLKEKIKSQAFPVGSKLPSEKVLSEGYVVSRLTVRMALQKLSAQGLVETRAGEGTYVKEFDLNEYLDEVADAVIRPEMLDDVYEFRILVELECARMAIERCTDSDFEKLDKLLADLKSIKYDFKNPNAHIVEEYVLKDFAFHAAICELSKNSLFHLTFMTMQGPITQYLRVIVESRITEYGQDNVDAGIVSIDELYVKNTHFNIVKHMKDRNYEACKDIYVNLANYKSDVT